MIQASALTQSMKMCTVEIQNGKTQGRNIMKINGMSIKRIIIVIKEINIMKIDLIIKIKMHTKAKHYIEFQDLLYCQVDLLAMIIYTIKNQGKMHRDNMLSIYQKDNNKIKKQED